MKRFIITILALTVLVGSVFAKPKMLHEEKSECGYTISIWDIGLTQKYVTYSEPLELFLVETLLDTTQLPKGSKKVSINQLHKDLQELINKYDYYVMFVGNDLHSLSYKTSDGNVWIIIY